MAGRTSLAGLNLLAVEDEMLVAMMLQDILQDAGCKVVCVGHLEQATLLAREQHFDAAILDENLHGERSYPVADALVARGIPFVFATGYGDTNLRLRYPGRPVINKPYTENDVITALAALTSSVQDVR
jgi:CheY-like chemotaxis protein